MSDDYSVTEMHGEIDISWTTIFNRSSFFAIHRNEFSYYFTMKRISTNEIIGVCHFSGNANGTYLSPIKGTFAGFELRKFDADQFVYFVRKTEQMLRDKGAKTIIIFSAPFLHDLSQQTHSLNIFINEGYSIYRHDINHSMQITETDLASIMQKAARKRFNKCIRNGFSFCQVNSTNEIKNVYDIITANRENKGYSVSMSLEQIMQMNEYFPENMFFFKSCFESKAVAASICIKLNSDVLYVFYWGHLPDYEQYSPIIFLASGIYEFAKTNRFKILDAGTSTIDGIPNHGLIRFKENLGFLASPKISYSKSIR